MSADREDTNEAPLKKARVANSLIDEEAEESGSEVGNESDDEVDRNEYVADDFLVNEDQDSGEESMDEIQREKKTFSRLKKKSNARALDIEDRELIEENLRDNKPEDDVESDEEIVPERVREGDEHEIA